MRYNAQQVSSAVAYVAKRLGCPVDDALQEQFEAGLYPALLAHERIAADANPLPVISRQLMGALSYVHQPVAFYDIFRVCRSVNVILRLESALRLHDVSKTEHLESRLERLRLECSHEGFDAVLFEVLTAARYAALPDCDRVSFIKETPNAKTPDILVVRNGRRSVIECKKAERIRQNQMVVRDVVRSLLDPILHEFHRLGVSVNGEVTFHIDPQQVGQSDLASAFRDSLRERTTIVSNRFTVKAVQIPPFDSDEGPTLYPSPLFSWKRYGYRVRSDWFGLVQYGNVRFGHWGSDPARVSRGQSSWILSAEWDAGIKWKIDQEEIVSRYRRFAFNSVFKGLVQLQTQKADAGLHLWLESEYFLRGRKDVLVDLFERLKASQRDRFSWVIVNETLLDVSPAGYFDLIEHAHMIKGPTAGSVAPPLSCVFTMPDHEGGSGEFGVGAQLADIDEAS